MTTAKVISIYCDADFHCQLRARAASQGRSVSRHVRWLIEEDIGIPHPNVVNRERKPREEDIPRE